MTDNHMVQAGDGMHPSRECIVARSSAIGSDSLQGPAELRSLELACADIDVETSRDKV